MQVSQAQRATVLRGFLTILSCCRRLPPRPAGTLPLYHTGLGAVADSRNCLDRSLRNRCCHRLVHSPIAKSRRPRPCPLRRGGVPCQHQPRSSGSQSRRSRFGHLVSYPETGVSAGPDLGRPIRFKISVKLYFTCILIVSSTTRSNESDGSTAAVLFCSTT